jgi:hypothetical protein
MIARQQRYTRARVRWPGEAGTGRSRRNRPGRRAGLMAEPMIKLEGVHKSFDELEVLRVST